MDESAGCGKKKKRAGEKNKTAKNSEAVISECLVVNPQDIFEKKVFEKARGGRGTNTWAKSGPGPVWKRGGGGWKKVEVTERRLLVLPPCNLCMHGL